MIKHNAKNKMQDKNEQYRKNNATQSKSDSKTSENSKKGFFSWSSEKSS